VPAAAVDEDLPLTPPEVGASAETSTAADSMGGSAPPAVAGATPDAPPGTGGAGAETAGTPTSSGDVTLEMPAPTGAADPAAPTGASAAGDEAPAPPSGTLPDTSTGGAPGAAEATDGVSAETASTDAASAGASSTGAVASDAAWTDAASTETASAGAASTETATDAATAGGASPDATGTDAVASAGAPGSGGTAAAGEALKADRIQLVGESGHSISVGVRTPLGKHMVRQFGEDFNVWDTEQCAVERGADGAWQLVPQAGTTNETLLNGQTVTEPRPLREGDVIAVGRAEKGIAKLPLTVRAG
jgi:hypothetical protein